jgi:hypothetical protein
VENMGKKNKLLVGAISAVAASVVAGAFVKKNLNKRNNKQNDKKNKSLYYTVSLNDIYNSYDDKTLSEEDMINEIKKETSL